MRLKKNRLYQNRIIRRKNYSVPPLYLYRTEKLKGLKAKRSIVPLFCFFLVIVGLLYLFLNSRFKADMSPASFTEKEWGQQRFSDKRIWQTMPELLAKGLDNLDGRTCLEIVDKRTSPYTLFTDLDEKYQKKVQRRLNISMALGGIATAIDPFSGRILALSVYNQDPENPVAFFWKAYPAASLFKITTAAAALEKGLLNPESIMTFTGRPHTLYRRDLSEKVYRWSNRINLRSAFARSVNPVFGKIGIHTLGQQTLSEYGTTFFFNQLFPSEIPFETSRLQVPEDPVGIAEIASGFNRQTLISSLHATWMGAVIIAGGAAPAPWLIKDIQDEKGRIIYEHVEQPPIRVVLPSTAKKLQELMEATVQRGTCRKSFAGRRRYKRLRPVIFGGSSRSQGPTHYQQEPLLSLQITIHRGSQTFGTTGPNSSKRTPIQFCGCNR